MPWNQASSIPAGIFCLPLGLLCNPGPEQTALPSLCASHGEAQHVAIIPSGRVNDPLGPTSEARD